MIVCPHCFHQNQDGATHCEQCKTELPPSTSCPNCGASIQANARFCGQCGYNLPTPTPTPTPTPAAPAPSAPDVELPAPDPPDPIPMMASEVSSEPLFSDPIPDAVDVPNGSAHQELPSTPAAPSLDPPEPPASPAPTHMQSSAAGSATQLQLYRARLHHVQTDAEIEIPPHLSVIKLGKPNDRVPPDIDVAGFPHSEVISRVHANIRVEDGSFFIEDVGSSNGTYINNIPLLPGNRHRLRAGDRIALGKGDLVTFLFQLD